MRFASELGSTERLRATTLFEAPKGSRKRCRFWHIALESKEGHATTYRGLFPLTSILPDYEQPWWRYAAGILDPSLVPVQTHLTHYRPDEFITHYGSNFAERPFLRAHSDIGGGYPDGRNLTALYWMWNLATAHGVGLKPIESYPDFGRLRRTIERPHDSRANWKYALDYVFPNTRLVFGTPGG